jgi:hypothetical protein
VIRIANARGAEGFVAVSADARKKFWLDRARTAAIARHTNAFKINEDVVIPLDRLGDYTDGVERINIELSLANKVALCDALASFLGGPALAAVWAPGGRVRDGGDRREGGGGTRAVAAVRCGGRTFSIAVDTPFAILQDHAAVASWRMDLRAPLTQILGGHAFAPVLARCNAIHQEMLRGRVFIALHMHAGDGNVHTNLPVNSDDYAMLREANAAVARIMALARSLGGVVSGEHGIVITKLEYLTPKAEPFARYEAKVDRRAIQRGQASRRGGPPAYTPSFSLIGHESDPRSVGGRRHCRFDQDCLRCGKCKRSARPVPRANLLYSRAAILSVPADRGFPLRGADAARSVAAAFRRVLGCRGPLHGVPQMPVTLPGRHRLRQCIDCDAQPLAPGRQEAVSAGDGRRDVLPERDRPVDHQASQGLADRLGYGVQRIAHGFAKRTPARSKQTTAAGSMRAPTLKSAGHPFHQQADAGGCRSAPRGR